MKNTKAFDQALQLEGAQAARAGKTSSECPYTMRSALTSSHLSAVMAAREQWMKGFNSVPVEAVQR